MSPRSAVLNLLHRTICELESTGSMLEPVTLTTGRKTSDRIIAAAAVTARELTVLFKVLKNPFL